MTISTIALALSGTWSDSCRVALGGFCELGPGAGRSPALVAVGELPRVVCRLCTCAGNRWAMPTIFRSQIRYDDPLNLSILLSGGKETNKDSLSKGD